MIKYEMNKNNKHTARSFEFMRDAKCFEANLYTEEDQILLRIFSFDMKCMAPTCKFLTVVETSFEPNTTNKNLLFKINKLSNDGKTITVFLNGVEGTIQLPKKDTILIPHAEIYYSSDDEANYLDDDCEDWNYDPNGPWDD